MNEHFNNFELRLPPGLRSAGDGLIVAVPEDFLMANDIPPTPKLIDLARQLLEGYAAMYAMADVLAPLLSEAKRAKRMRERMGGRP